MKLKSFILCLFVSCSAFAFDFSGAEFLQIPEGNVYQIKTGGEWIYPTNQIPYITNGLVAYWDAIWNTGLGVHDSEATVWKDLVGTRDFTLVGNQYWGDNSWVVNAYTAGSGNPTYATFSAEENFPSNHTLEVVVYPKQTGSSVARIICEADGTTAPYWVPNIMIHYNKANILMPYRYWGASVVNAAVDGYNTFLPHIHVLTHESGSTNVNYYIDGELLYTFTDATSEPIGKTMSLANYTGSGSAQYKRAIDGEYYAIRIYNRILTDEEIKYNSAIDALRFDNRDLCDDDAVYESVSNSYKKVKVNEKILWSVIPYVNEGLVDWWDAKWNVGIGQHNNETNRWKDLVGTRDALLYTNYYWTDNSWVVQSVSNNGLASMTGGQFPKSQTWQIVLKPTDWIGRENGSRIIAGPVNLRFMATNTVSWYASYGVGPNYAVPNYDIFQLHQHTVTHEEDSPTVKYWIDGKCVYTNNSATANSDTSQYLYFANRSRRDIGIDAEYHTVRLYDRVLTDDEIFRNTRADVKRYGIPQYWCEFSFRDGSTVITNLTSMDARYRENLNLVDVKLGTDCKTLSSYIFLDCKNLTNIVMPNVNRIYYWTFRWCTNLTSVVIPESCTQIDYSAFFGCYGLTNVVLPDTLTTLGHMSLTAVNIGSFQYCTSLSEIRLPNSLTTLGRKTFNNCTSLKEVTNSEHLETIGLEAFSYCTNLTEFTFGPDIETLETNVFLNSGIQTINYYKKDTETNEEAETRIKALVEGTGLDISDKEFICLNYDYSSGAWSHIDMTDASTLFTDDALTIHPEIGESAQRIQDKANQDIVYRVSTNMIRTEYGIKSTRFDDEGEALYNIIYQTNELFNAETDYNNVEFATAIVIDNEKGKTDFTTHATRIVMPGNYKVFMLYYGSSATDRGLTIRALNNTQINVPPVHRKNFQDGPQLFVVSVKSVDGQVTAKVYINGVLIGTYQTTVGEDIAGTSFMPALGLSGNNNYVPADYCENLWWDHIPENIDGIQQALMRKYGIKNQTIYFKDAASWVELTDEGTIYTNSVINAANQAEIGDEVKTCRDKITAYQWTVSGMVRTEYGLRPTNIVSNDYADTWQLYASSPRIKPADTDWANMEMAFAIMTCNDTCTDRGFGVVRLIECATSSYITRLYYNATGKLYSRLLKFGGIIVSSGTNLRSILQNKPTLYVCQLKVVDGVATEVVSINGKKFTISGAIDPDYVSGRYFLPGIKSNASYGGMPVDYQEVLFWDHIPEDIDDIEKALMDKYNVEPLVIE